MKASHSFKKVAVPLLVAGTMVSAPAAFAASGTAGQPGAAAQDTVQQQERTEARKNRGRIIADAAAAVVETRTALAALEKNDRDAAMKALERAIGKLEAVLARAPEMALTPIDVRTEILDLYADIEAVRAAKEKVRDLLDEGRLQEARRLMSGLASEIVIRVVNVPLASYTAAVKAIVPLVDQGKTEEARKALEDVLSTLVVTEYAVPLPLLRVDEMMARAKALSEKENRSEAEQKELDGILKAMRTELKFAEALGYGTKEEYAVFYKEIDSIEDKVAGGKFGKGYFETLTDELAKLRDRLRGNHNKGDK